MGGSAYQTIDRSLTRLQGLIDGSLVNLQRDAMVARHSRIHRENVSLRSLISGVWTDVALEASERDVTVECDVPELSVVGDSAILYSAISNLARNAVKFTHGGGRVIMRAGVVGDSVHIEVEDQCGGLPPESLEKIFDPFVQVGEDRSGFGLGLSITKHAAEAHGGAVHVRNIVGKGCMFVLEIPVGHAAE
jgi:signal transduction histidine kinase